MTLTKLFTLIFLSIIVCLKSFGQAHHETEDAHRKNSISYFNGLTFIPKVHDEELDVANYVTTIGITYHRSFNDKIGISWMNDIELGDYLITVSEELIPRENVFISALAFQYRVIGGLELFVGPGIELERHRNFFVLRAGMEYQLFVANDWYLGPEIMFDFKEEYHSWSFGVLIIKHF